jgi:hypothetical protein
MMNQDFKELLLAFNDEKVEYLIVGAHALAVYGYVRATKDLDVWIKPAEVNARKVIAGLNSFGSPLGDVTHNDLMRAGTIFQIGIAPLRIDLLTSIDGVSFTEAWADRQTSMLGEVPVFVISRHHLIANKKASGRPQDIADINELESSN